MVSSWSAVVSGALRDDTLAAVEAVIQDVTSAASGWGPAGLNDGQLGFALFFDMASRLTGGHQDEAMVRSLMRAMELFAHDRRKAPGLHGGLGGLGWTALHLASRHPELDVEELCTEVDEALETALRAAGPHSCDLQASLSGFGLYALKRLPHPAGQRLLELVVDRLAETAEPAQGGLSWPQPRPYWRLHGAEATFPRGLYTVGVAHGVPAALAILAAAHRLGLAREKTERLLRGGFGWLEHLAAPEGPPNFPHYLHGTERFTDERFAWCVGNPGITAVSWWAAHLWAEPTWEARALHWASQVAREALERPSTRHSNLCCGASGTALLFLRLFHATRLPVFEEAAVRWVRHTLALRRPGEGVGGFLFEQEPTRHMPVLHYGAAGTALALLAAASDLAPDWDAAFLFSLQLPSS
ncbi:lanthionine synthetase LanC family protein [Archangium sp.]|uniref:lanthionine synthetase LanC family protein n=1 Tax=Archangium sp. TaxID=1872627 RepID=UPI00286CC96D|nr:lanthionine synthetase LanC family protein [Archangium sp.]